MTNLHREPVLNLVRFEFLVSDQPLPAVRAHLRGCKQAVVFRHVFGAVQHKYGSIRYQFFAQLGVWFQPA